MQSAYRKFHLTESAVLQVLSDIYSAADEKMVTLLGLLDLSAAFDTVDHQILFDRLRYEYGLDGSVLSWFKSYLTNRTICFHYNGRTSETVSPFSTACHRDRCLVQYSSFFTWPRPSR